MAAPRIVGKVALALEVVATYLQVRLRVRHTTLPAALADLRRPAEPPWSREADDVARLGRAVQRTLAFLPARGRCLTQSLVLTRILSRRGIPSQLVIGVAPDEAFAAHAWVERDSVPLLPPLGRRFDELTRL